MILWLLSYNLRKAAIPAWILILISFSLAKAQSSPSENSLNPVYGIYGSYNYNFHFPDFQKLPDVPNCCPRFDKGGGSGLSLGVLYELPLPYSLTIGLRAGFSLLSGSLSKIEGTYIRVDSNIVPGKFEHSLEAKLGIFELEPLLSYRVYEGLHIFGGGFIGFYLQNDYSQKEIITEPKDRGVFVGTTNSRIRNDSSGTIPDILNVFGGIKLGAGYTMPLNKDTSLSIAPEIFYNIGMTDVVKNLKWKISSLGIGFSIRYQPKSKKIEMPIFRESETIVDTIVVESGEVDFPAIAAGLPVKSETKEIVDGRIIFKEIIRRTDTLFKPTGLYFSFTFNTPVEIIHKDYIIEEMPIIPAVFFKDNSAQISDFYNLLKENNNFYTDSLSTNAVVFQKNILNIIGERLKKNKDANIVLKGYSDPNTENGDCSLALSRAVAVKEYLTDVWGISENRIQFDKHENGCVPSSKPKTKGEKAYSENRRVEINSVSREILAPVERQRFSKILRIEQARLEIKPVFSDTNKVESWSLKLSDNSRIIYSQQGERIPNTVNIELPTFGEDWFSENGGLYIMLDATDKQGKQHTSTQFVNIKKEVEESGLGDVLYVQFEVASAELPPGAVRNIEEYLEKLGVQRKIRITGYSDDLGDNKKNQVLSEERAANIYNLMKETKPNLSIVRVKGVGITQNPYGINSYGAAAERFLSRTVRIEAFNR